jgi:UDP-2,3-diacylglucosamine pyrophosphatase LpxH
MRPILFLSDIHLGSNLFNLEDGLIELLNNDYENIYILGDLIDTWEMSISEILYRYKRIINFIRSKRRIEIILGNHDPEYEIMKEIFPKTKIYKEEHKIKINGYNIIMIHGDKFDSLLTPYLFIMNHILKYIYNITDKKLKKNFRDNLRNLYYKAKYQNYTYNIISNMERYTINYYRDKLKYDVLIMGHTHLAKVVHTPFFKYMNCGCIIYNPCFLQYENEKFELIRI